MNKLLFFVVSLSILLLYKVDSFAQCKGNRQNSQRSGVNCQFVDLNKDKVCDNFIDLDNDGRCDFGKRNGSMKGGKSLNYQSRGKGICKRDFIDANNDGICDNFQSKVFVLRPFPNPFSSSTNFELSLPRSGEVHITLNNLEGKEMKLIHKGVLEKGVHKFSVDSQNLTSGRYLIVVNFEGQIYSKQVHFIP